MGAWGRERARGGLGERGDKRGERGEVKGNMHIFFVVVGVETWWGEVRGVRKGMSREGTRGKKRGGRGRGRGGGGGRGGIGSKRGAFSLRRRDAEGGGRRNRKGGRGRNRKFGESRRGIRGDGRSGRGDWGGGR